MISTNLTDIVSNNSSYHMIVAELTAQDDIDMEIVEASGNSLVYHGDCFRVTGMDEVDFWLED